MGRIPRYNCCSLLCDLRPADIDFFQLAIPLGLGHFAVGAMFWVCVSLSEYRKSYIQFWQQPGLDDGGDEHDNNDNKIGTNKNRNKWSDVAFFLIPSLPRLDSVGLDWDTLNETLNPNFPWEDAVRKALGTNDTLEEVLLL